MRVFDSQSSGSAGWRLRAVAPVLFQAFLCAVLAGKLIEPVTGSPWIRVLVAAATLTAAFGLLRRAGASPPGRGPVCGSPPAGHSTAPGSASRRGG